MKIAIMYICTGNYECFWDDFYRTSEEMFYPGIEKHYFVFTESQRILAQKHANVTCVYQARAGWPYDTLLRFHWFAMVQDRMPEYDYCYYFNANSLLLRSITPELIPLPTDEKPLIFWCHTQQYDDYSSDSLSVETNPESTAYIAPDTACRYHGGGFFGGTSAAFLRMTLELRDNIQADLDKGIIAVWHDQSHTICYSARHPHLEVGRDLMCEEYLPPVEGTCALRFRSKDDYGGVDNLRENGPGPRFRHAVIRCYRAVLAAADTIGVGGLFRNFAKLFAGRRNWYR